MAVHDVPSRCSSRTQIAGWLPGIVRDSYRRLDHHCNGSTLTGACAADETVGEDVDDFARLVVVGLAGAQGDGAVVVQGASERQKPTVLDQEGAGGVGEVGCEVAQLEARLSELDAWLVLVGLSEPSFQEVEHAHLMMESRDDPGARRASSVRSCAVPSPRRVSGSVCRAVASASTRRGIQAGLALSPSKGTGQSVSSNRQSSTIDAATARVSSLDSIAGPAEIMTPASFVERTSFFDWVNQCSWAGRRCSFWKPTAAFIT